MKLSLTGYLIAIHLMLLCYTVSKGEVVIYSNQDQGDNPGLKVRHLFDGKDLNGWYTFLERRGKNRDPKGVFKVENGIIRISGQEFGCITTQEEFENYHLVVEYKWGDRTFAPREGKARDGGVLVHSQGSDGAYGGHWMHSIEVQIIEGGTGDVLVVGDGSSKFSASATVKSGTKIFEPAGAEVIAINKGRIDWHSRDPDWKDVAGFRGANEIEHPLGEWNTLEVIAMGDDIKIFLNNQFVNHVFNVTPRKGRIQIQSEGAEMFVKKVDLVPLPPDFRFMFNSDANNMFTGDEDTPEKLHPYVDEVALAGVTSYFISPNWGMPMNFPTKVGDMIGEHLSKELEADLPESVNDVRTLVSNGHDPLAIFLERARAHRMEAFVSFRLNEVHGVENDDSYIFDRFWRQHPEWRIGKAGDELSPLLVDIIGPRSHPIVSSWLPGGLNFAISEVRDYRMAQLREICERYNIDGLEMDFQRFPMYFKPGEEAAGIPIMNEWMRRVSAMVREVGRSRGRPILFSARVLALPEQNTGMGLDPVTWAHEGLVDFMIVSHYLHNNFVLPVNEYRQLFPKGFPIYASIEVEPDMHGYRNVTYPLWQQNVNGISLFNFFTSKGSANPPPYDSIKMVGYPVVTTDSVLLVANKQSNTLSFVDPKTLAVTESIAAGPNPHEIIVSLDQRTAYLNNYDHPNSSISVIDLKSRKLVKEISTGYYSHGRLSASTTSPDGRYVYFLVEFLNQILEVDTRTNRIGKAIATHGRLPSGLCATPDGKYLLTANTGSNDVSVLNRSNGWLVKKIPVGKGANGMAVTPDRKSLWVLNGSDGTITVIDLQTLEPSRTIACAGMPSRIVFTADGERALVTGRTREGTLSIIDVAGGKLIRRINVGAYANGITLSPDERYAFVGENADSAEVMPDSAPAVSASARNSQGVQVVDLKTFKVLSTIKTGSGPDAMTLWYPLYK